MDINHLTLLTDLYELTMMQGYFKTGNDETVVFDVFYRDNPSGSGYAITCGLDQVIDYIKNLSFSYDDIDYLRNQGIFDEDFLEYLAGYHFTGDIYAIAEGTVVFPRSKSDRYESFSCSLCCWWKWGYGIRTSPCSGT